MTEEEIEEKTDKVKTMFVSVTKMYRVEYKVDYTLETTEEEDEVEEEMETWAHDHLVDETIDADQLINQMKAPTGITIESSEHCSGLMRLRSKHKETTHELRLSHPNRSAISVIIFLIWGIKELWTK